MQQARGDVDMITEDQKRAALIRSKARKFANEVKAAAGLALKLPDELIDSISDEDWPAFRLCCQYHGIRQRKDYFWEKAEDIFNHLSLQQSLSWWAFKFL